MVAGHICLDITPKFISKESDSIRDILIPGKLVNVGEADIHTGGAVANTGLAMRILGAAKAPGGNTTAEDAINITLAGKIGDDAFGDMVYSIADSYSAADGLIRRKGESTSYSVVLAVPGTDRIFLHHPGANDTFCSDDISEESLKGVTLFHFGYPPLMKRMYENSGDELVSLFKKVKRAGAAASLDMAAVDPDSAAGKLDFRTILKRVLPFTDIFVPSIEELMFMLDRDKYDVIRKRAGTGDFCASLDIERDVRPLAEECKDMGAKIVLIKCGVPGMYLSTQSVKGLEKLPESLGLNTAAWSEVSLFEKSYRPDKVLSATGAGDTSIAAFLTALLKGYEPGLCMQLAVAEGASCVSAYDALSGLKPLDELRDKIESGWEKV